MKYIFDVLQSRIGKTANLTMLAGDDVQVAAYTIVDVGCDCVKVIHEEWSAGTVSYIRLPVVIAVTFEETDDEP